MSDLVAARERFAPPPRVHVVVKKEDIDASRLEGRVVLVLDILFATTTIVAALEAGATAVLFAEDQHEWAVLPLHPRCAGDAGAVLCADRAAKR